MKEHYIDIHSTFCPCGEGKSPCGFNAFCEMNPERFLFFVGTKFVLVTYHNCMNFGDEYSFKAEIINKCIGDSKIFDYWDVVKSITVDDDLRRFRIHNEPLKKHIQQVNFLYTNNAGKKYAITTKTKYLDTICNQDEINKNFKDMECFLLKNNYNWLITQLRELHYANRVYEANDVEYHKTIEHITNSINKLTK